MLHKPVHVPPGCSITLIRFGPLGWDASTCNPIGRGSTNGGRLSLTASGALRRAARRLWAEYGQNWRLPQGRTVAQQLQLHRADDQLHRMMLAIDHAAPTGAQHEVTRMWDGFAGSAFGTPDSISAAIHLAATTGISNDPDHAEAMRWLLRLQDGQQLPA